MQNRRLNNIFLHVLGLGILAALLLMTAPNALAAPARPVEVSVPQPDGSKFQAVPWGDEWVNGMETSQGYTIILSQESNFWVYAQLTADKKLAPMITTGKELIVGRDDPTGIPKHIRPEPISTDEMFYPGDPGFWVDQHKTGNIGDRKVLVLLVEFQDVQARTSENHWFDKVFGEVDSLRHYYQEASLGKLNLLPAEESSGLQNNGIVGWITLPYNHPNYRGNISSYSQTIARDAILAADPYVNYAAFDKNNDGYISYDELHIMIIVAGNETAYGGSAGTCPPSIWGHAWYFRADAPILDGKRIASSLGGGGYTQMGEWHCEIGDEPGHPATIGMLVHEFGHDLGWPDLYDTSFRSAGLGYWDVMSHGLWNNRGANSPDGSSPALPNAWSRWHQGWVTPQQINTSVLGVSVPAVQESGIVYQLLHNPNGVDWIFNIRRGTGEYYLVENRQKIGYDLGLPGSGLLIWHINENAPFDNSANADPNRRLVDLIQADGLRQLNLNPGNRGDPGDPYPGTTFNRIFNASSNPSSLLHGGIVSGVSVTAISNSSPFMTANFFVTTFTDVLPSEWSWVSVESLVASGVTIGCGGGKYCPHQLTTRAEMAVFLIRAIHGQDYTLPTPTGNFSDVTVNHWAASWIEHLYAEGITVGCGIEPLRFCPEDAVTRAEMAVFLLRSKYGQNYAPPPAQGIFPDVGTDHWAAAWIEQLYHEGITTGCSEEQLNYCPDWTLTREEMAAFLTRTFNFHMP